MKVEEELRGETQWESERKAEKEKIETQYVRV